MRAGLRPLFMTWLALLAMLALTAATAWLKLGWVNTALGLAVALAKAVLVALVFMRLRRAPALVRLAAVAGVVALAVLFGLWTADDATRDGLPARWQRPQTVPARVG
jgi:cytochrome c oxidase subunit IV